MVKIFLKLSNTMLVYKSFYIVIYYFFKNYFSKLLLQNFSNILILLSAIGMDKFKSHNNFNLFRPSCKL